MHFNSGIGKLENQLKEQQKIINYYRECYKNHTGNDLSMPQSWSQFQKLQDSEAPLLDNIPDSKNYGQMDNEELERLAKAPMPVYDVKTGKTMFKDGITSENFLQAFYKLNLPNMKKDGPKKPGDLMGSKKGKLTTNFDVKNPFHMTTKIDLSNFKNQEFTNAAFREFVDSINDMRCLNTLILKNNGIDDDHLKELESIFDNKKITKLDLSKNEIGKKGCLMIANSLKSKNKHLQWLDISRNNFSYEQQAIAMLELGLREQKNLYHLCIDMSSIDAKFDTDTQEPAPKINPFNKKNTPGSNRNSIAKKAPGADEEDNGKFNPNDKNPMKNTTRYNKFVVSENIAHLLQTNTKLTSLCMIDSVITGNAMKIIKKALKDPKRHLFNLGFKFCNLGKLFIN